MLGKKVAHIGGPNSFVEHAVYGEFSEVLRFINAGKDLDVLHTHLGVSALHASAEFNHIRVIKLLLVAGASIDNLDTKGQTPLHLAAAAGRTEALRLLLERRSDKHIKSKRGKTASRAAPPAAPLAR